MEGKKLRREAGWFTAAALVLGSLGSSGLYGNFPYNYTISGPSAWLVWLITLIFGFIVALVLAYDYTIWPEKTGAEYYPVRASLGSLLGSIAGWGFSISWGTTPAIVALILGRYIWGVAPETALTRQLFAISVITIFFILNYFGIKVSGIAQNIVTVFKVVPLIIVGLVAIPFINPSYFTPFWKSGVEQINPSTPIGMFTLFLASALVASWSTYATDVFASIVSEVKDPKKNIPRAAVGSGLIALLFVGLITITAVGVLGEGLATMARPLFQYGKIVLGDLGVILLWIALLAGVLGACNASMISASRVLYQMSEEGDLPGIFSKLNGWGVPHIALITIWLLNVLMILYTPLYIVLVAVTQVPFLLTWFLIGVANIKIRGNREWHEKAAFKIPWILAIAALIVGVLSLGFIYAYGIMYGWSDIEIGVIFVVLVIILWFINKITRKSH